MKSMGAGDAGADGLGRRVDGMTLGRMCCMADGVGQGRTQGKWMGHNMTLVVALRLLIVLVIGSCIEVEVGCECHHALLTVLP